MENTSLTSFAWENVTSSLESENAANYLTNIRDQVLKVIYIIIGTVGVVDNVFVLVIFFLFVKITDKVCGLPAQFTFSLRYVLSVKHSLISQILTHLVLRVDFFPSLPSTSRSYHPSLPRSLTPGFKHQFSPNPSHRSLLFLLHD